MAAIYQIGGPSPFPIITSFLAYAIARQIAVNTPPQPTKGKKP